MYIRNLKFNICFSTTQSPFRIFYLPWKNPMDIVYKKACFTHEFSRWIGCIFVNNHLICFEKEDKYLFKARNACREFLALNAYFSKEIRWLFTKIHPKSWKLVFKTGFLVHNIHLILLGQVENSKWRLCGRKTDVKCFWVQNLFIIIFVNKNIKRF